jgi:hypothetical protein
MAGSSEKLSVTGAAEPKCKLRKRSFSVETRRSKMSHFGELACRALSGAHPVRVCVRDRRVKRKPSMG